VKICGLGSEGSEFSLLRGSCESSDKCKTGNSYVCDYEDYVSSSK
jgi:hypothetical protein